jgi:phage tail protein X
VSDAGVNLEQVEGTITKKLGPFPGWVWIILAAGVGYLVYRYIKSRSAGSTTVDDTSDSDPTAGAAGAALSTVDTTGTSAGDSDTTGDGTSTAPPSDSNAAWALRVTNALDGQGTYTTQDITNALADYINGKTLSTLETTIVQVAVAGYGPPPEGLIGIKSNGTVVTDPTVKHYYTTKIGDTVSSIADAFYGAHTTHFRSLIISANPGIASSGPVKVGKSLVIPGDK